MTIEFLTSFFMWCTIINGSILVFWSVILLIMPTAIYTLQTKWLPISRESFNHAMYYFLGGFKLLFIMFNLVPFIALLMISG